MHQPARSPMLVPVVEVRTRLDDQVCATELASVVVLERLAACAHVRGPFASTYRWAGSIVNATEFEFDAVTTSERAKELMARIESMHPYELPAVLVTDAYVSVDYARWVDEQTAG